MSGIAIAGTLANTRSLLGLSHVFPQSSILYGPRRGNSSSAFPGDTRTVPATPTAAATMLRRVILCIVVDMSSSPLLRTRAQRRVVLLKQRMSVPNRRRLPVTKMFSRVALVDYVGGNQRTSIVRGEVCENAGRYQAQVARASVRSPLQRLCGSVVCRKETLESKLRESHVDWRAENRRG